METLAFQDVRPDDEAAFFQLFAAVRAEELRMEGWDPEVRNQTLRLQFEAQRRGYRQQYPSAQVRLILRAGAPVGWVTVDRSQASVHCVDIAVIAAERSKGVGTQVIRALQEEAAEAGRSVVLRVLRTNARALGLYVKLGFRGVGDTDLHTLMEWRP